MVCSHCGMTGKSGFYKSMYQRKSNLCKTCTKRFIKERKLFLKLKAIEAKGGKCVKCGHSNPFSLGFHHKRDKNYSISFLCSRSARWEQIEREIEKCELLCANCHREHHGPGEIKFEFDHESLLKHRKRKLEARVEVTCLCCNRVFNTCRSSKFCSRRCNLVYNKKRIPSLIAIENAKKTMSWRKVGEFFGVGDSTIRRWKTLLLNQDGGTQ